jgi:SSS family solute:Na+ symporter
VSLHLALLLSYALLQVLIGLWVARRVRGAGDFFVAGRRLGPGLLFATLLAANIGAGSTVGATGLGYRDGIAAWWWVGSAGIGSIVLGLLVGPRIRRIAAEKGLHTVGDFLEWRFGRAVRGLIALLLWFGTLAILAGQLIAAGKILHVVTGLPPAVGALIGGGVLTVYFTAGGLLGAAWVNAVQLVVEVSVFAALLPAAILGAGGWEAVVARAPAGASYWSFWQGGGSGISYVALLVPAFVISPGLLQKVYGARDDRAVRAGVGLNALFLLLFAFVPTLLGIVARSRHPGLPDHELALPTILLHDLPPLLGALGLAAAFTTDVNTADAILFMLATSLAQDLYRGFVDRKASDAKVLKVARGAAVAGGALGIAIAVVAPSVIGALSIFYTLLSVSLFVPVIGGLFLPSVGPREALASIGFGVAAMLAAQLLTGGRGWGAFTPVLVGLLASMAGVVLAKLAARPSLPLASG